MLMPEVNVLSFNSLSFILAGVFLQVQWPYLCQDGEAGNYDQTCFWPQYWSGITVLLSDRAFKTLEGKLVLIYLLNGYLYFFVSSKMMCKVSLDDSVSLVHSEKFVFSSSLWWALSWHISPLFYVQVLLEFKEYATEVDVDFVRKAVRAIGRCAIKLERAAERCINVLLDLIKMKVNYVVQEAIIVIKDIFRRYPNT